jgi:hypothetical protein
MKYKLKEHINHIQDRQSSTCEKYLTASSLQYHVFQALSYFSRDSRREIVNYDMGSRWSPFTNAFDSPTNHQSPKNIIMTNLRRLWI